MRIVTIVVASLIVGINVPASAQLVHGNPGQAANTAPDSRDYGAADESINHPKRNPRHRVCKYYRDAIGHRARHCVWK
jgi:hypothetical protein